MRRSSRCTHSLSQLSWLQPELTLALSLPLLLLLLFISRSSSTSTQTLLESDPTEAERLEALRRVIPSAEAHDTIQRAWQLHQRHRREAHTAELARKYAAMRSALSLLEQTSPQLYREATEGRKFQNVDQARATNARLEGIVPREMRVPTERPGAQLWDYEWKAPVQQKQQAAAGAGEADKAAPRAKA